MIIYYSFLLIITPRDVIVTEQFFARLNIAVATTVNLI